MIKTRERKSYQFERRTHLIMMNPDQVDMYYLDKSGNINFKSFFKEEHFLSEVCNFFDKNNPFRVRLWAYDEEYDDDGFTDWVLVDGIWEELDLLPKKLKVEGIKQYASKLLLVSWMPDELKDDLRHILRYKDDAVNMAIEVTEDSKFPMKRRWINPRWKGLTHEQNTKLAAFYAWMIG